MLGPGHDAADAGAPGRVPQGPVEKRLTVGRRIADQSKVALENGLQTSRTGQTGLPDEPMGWEDSQAAVLGTGQIRQNVLKGSVCADAGFRGPLAAVLQRGFIAVMAVGDNQGFVRELSRNVRNACRILEWATADGYTPASSAISTRGPAGRGGVPERVVFERPSPRRRIDRRSNSGAPGRRAAGRDDLFWPAQRCARAGE